MKSISCIQRTSQWEKHWVRRFFGGLPATVMLLGLLLSCNSAFAAIGQLSSLVVANLSPAFDPAVTNYTIPKTSSCSAPVTATLANPTANSKLYVANNPATSGSKINAWYCSGDGIIQIVIYNVWTEVGRYTITPVQQAPPPPPIPPVSGKLTGLNIANLTPAFDPNVTQYTVPLQPPSCSVPTTATVADPTNPNLKLYISSNPTTSGATVNAWVCGNQPTIHIVIYDVWTVVGDYVVTPVIAQAPPTSGSGGSTTGTGSGSSSCSTTPPPPAIANPPTEQIPATPPPPLPLPAASPVGKASAVRFLGQATFGPTPTDIATVQTVGLPYWMAQQYNLPMTVIPDGLNTNQVTSQLFANMANAPDELRQRMVFALSQIFVVSTNKNVNGDELIPWVTLLERNAFGNFRTLLKEVTFSPTMGKYLDLANSMRATASTSPNENYPREAMQLFTIGLNQLNQDGSTKLDALGQPIPTYDQTTVREMARALTGLTYPTAPGNTPQTNNWEYFVGLMEYRQSNHDTGTKTLLNGTVLPANQSVKQDIDAVIDNLFQHPNTAPFIATRLIRTLVKSNPSPAYIQRVANVFVDNGHGVRGDLWAVLTAIFTDAEAQAAPLTQTGHLKDPVIHVLNLCRALGAQVTDPSQFLYIFRNLGEQVLSPDTVFSFYSPLAPLPGNPSLYGPEFQIDSPGLAIQRANFIYQILTGQIGSALTINLTPFTTLAGNPSALVEQVNQTLFQGSLSDGLRQVLLSVVGTGYDAPSKAQIALYFAAISSEYSVQP